MRNPCTWSLRHVLVALCALAIPTAAPAATDWNAACATDRSAPVSLLEAPPVEECYQLCRPVYDDCRAQCAAQGESEWVCFRRCIGWFWACVADCTAEEGATSTTAAEATDGPR